ncbi:hypothetical protein HD554DRAFT_2142150 [Boletus coccyginus]|nr:hypothetical protein HD554DRAFT_2142150 [Boletus coccyginus]
MIGKTRSSTVMIPQAAQDLPAQITLFPTNAKDFFVADVYGCGTQNTWGPAWIRSIVDGPAQFRAQNPPLNVAFDNFTTIWDGVLGPIQGIRRFGTRARGLASSAMGRRKADLVMTQSITFIASRLVRYRSSMRPLDVHPVQRGVYMHQPIPLDLQGISGHLRPGTPSGRVALDPL